MPIEPMRAPFWVLVQSKTVGAISMRARGGGRRRTIKGEERKRELDTGEHAEEEEVQLAKCTEQREPLADARRRGRLPVHVLVRDAVSVCLLLVLL